MPMFGLDSFWMREDFTFRRCALALWNAWNRFGTAVDSSFRADWAKLGSH